MTSLPAQSPPGSTRASRTSTPAASRTSTPALLCLLLAACAAKAPDIGASPLLRITRGQYDRLARDLLSPAFVPSTVLPADESIGPFAVNAATVPSRGLIEQYELAAQRLGAEVEADPDRWARCAAGQAAHDCVAAFVHDFGERASRRPLSPEQEARWVALYDRIAAAQGHATGLRSVVEGLLQSASFLYRIELLPDGRLDGFAIASRLSFLLWNSGPDAALLAAAAGGELSTQRGIAAQAERLLADARFGGAAQDFADAWAGVAVLGAQPIGGARGLDDALLAAMRREAGDFLRLQLTSGDGRLADVLTAGTTSADPRVVRELYGSMAAADARGRVQLPAERSGVLSLPGVMFVYAHPDQTSPVLRGKWVREALLCDQLPDPPPDVILELPPPQPTTNARDRLALHRQSSGCSGCHVLMDDIGLGFETFDNLGRLQTTEGGKPIDASGALTGTDVDGTFVAVPQLGKKLAASTEAAKCFAQQWFRFGLGREPAEGEPALVETMAHEVKEGGGFKAMVGALVGSDSFSMRRSP